MTDDLRERVAMAIFIAGGYPIDAVPFDRHKLREEFLACADAALEILQPGDVLPNGWVAPDDATSKMLEAFADSNKPNVPYCRSYRAMRAAAIREREG